MEQQKDLEKLYDLFDKSTTKEKCDILAKAIEGLAIYLRYPERNVQSQADLRGKASRFDA